ncbi:MAG: citramalate synthase [Bacillota bacterium]
MTIPSQAKPVIEIYETTLRDGCQGPGISLTMQDKINLTLELDRLGVHYIEGGWPGSNPKDSAYFKAAGRLPLKRSTLVAFGCTCRPGGNPPEEDANLRMLLEAGTGVVTLVGKASAFQVTRVLRTNLDENLRIIRDSIAFLMSHSKAVFFDAEHYFTGFKEDPGYALACLEVAREAGASRLILCDTTGGSLPWEVAAAVLAARERLDVPLGFHGHDDGGLAVANSLEAVKSGAIQIQGTINGYGERCGNADLCAIIPNLVFKMGYPSMDPGDLQKLARVSRYVAEVTNQKLDLSQPFVGVDAFVHKGGLHADAVAKDVTTYEHIEPGSVGNTRRIPVSELAGKSSILMRLDELGIAVAPEDRARVASEILDRIKIMEHEGFHYEAAEASFELLVRRVLGEEIPSFENLGFRIIVEMAPPGGALPFLPGPGTSMMSDATIKLMVAGRVVHAAAEGNGPVNALDNALRKALIEFYPSIGRVRLADYKVRVLDGHDGTESVVRVMIESTDGQRTWNTMGVSGNIIEASWQALVDAISYWLIHSEESGLPG